MRCEALPLNSLDHRHVDLFLDGHVHNLIFVLDLRHFDRPLHLLHHWHMNLEWIELELSELFLVPL